MSSDKSLIVFKAIAAFVNDLNDFTSGHRSLRLYCHLINKTTLAHEKAIEKHIGAFTDFCVSNREGITSKDYKKFGKNTIEYSEKCFIDISKILRKADSDNKESIWKHLLILSALTDPEARAKEILKQDASNEGNFLNKILSKVEKEVDGKSNPMEAISSVLQSGVFNEVIQDMNEGFKSGELDLGKMMGTMQSVMGQIPTSTSSDDNPNGQIDMSAMNSMMQNLVGTMSTNNTETPDLNNIMSVLSNTSSEIQPSPETPNKSAEKIVEIDDITTE